MNRSPWSFKLCNLMGAPIQIQIGLFILLFWLLLERPIGSNQHILRTFFPLTLFLCYFLQGLLCLLLACFLKVRVSDLTLYPFGAVPTFIRQADDSKQLAVAVSAPAFTGLISALLLSQLNPTALQAETADQPLLRLFVALVMVTILNLMPILPLPGGHIYKAAFKGFRVKSGHSLVSKVGPICCVLVLVLSAASGDLAFIFISASAAFLTFQVMLQHNAKSLIEQCTVADAMIARDKIELFNHGTLISQAIEQILSSLQSSFPVLIGQQVIGILEKDNLLRAAAFNDSNAYISEYMEREFPELAPTEPLVKALEIFELSKINILPVVSASQFVGAIFRSKFYEFMLVQNIKKHTREQAEEIRTFGDGDL